MSVEQAVRDVLLVTIAWPRKGNHNIYTDLAREFRDRGHHVTVVCASERRYGQITCVAEEDGVRVLRVRCGNMRETGRIEKTVSAALLGLQMRVAIERYLGDQTYELLLCSTPPITLAGLMRALKNRYKASFYLLLKDIWPQAAVDLGALRVRTLPWYYFRYYERLMYRAADYIGCTSPAAVGYLLQHNPALAAKCLEVCPNSERPRQFPAVDREAVLTRLGLPADRTVFVFGGNLGKPQGVSFLLDAVEALRHRDDIFFIMVGAGTEYEATRKRLAEIDTGSARLVQRLPDDDYRNVVAACDVGLILLDRRFTVPNFPARLLPYLQAGKPVLAATDCANDVGDIIEGNGCGLKVLHGDLPGFLAAVDRLAENRESRVQMGKNARMLFERDYTTASAYETIVSHFGV